MAQLMVVDGGAALAPVLERKVKKIELPPWIREELRANPGETIQLRTSKAYVSAKFPFGKWVAEVRRPNDKTGRIEEFPVKGFSTAEEAMEYVRSTRPTGAKGTRGAKQAVQSRQQLGAQLRDCYKYWMDIAGATIEQKTFNERERHWKLHVEPVYGHYHLGDIHQADIQSWVTAKYRKCQEEDGKGWPVFIESFADMKAMLELWIEHHDPDRRNPLARTVVPPRAMRPNIDIPSHQWGVIFRTIDKLTGAPSGDFGEEWIAQMFKTSLLTGTRSGETMAITWPRVRFDRGCLEVWRAMRRDARDVDDRTDQPIGAQKKVAFGLPKGKKKRFVPMSHQLTALFEDMKEKRQPPLPGCRDYVWPSEIGTMKASRFGEAWGTLAKHLNILAKAAPLDHVKGDPWPEYGTIYHYLKDLIDEMRARPELRIPDIWDLLDFRDTRNSFATYMNDCRLSEAEKKAFMGHAPQDVLAKFYTSISDKALADTRRILSEGWEAAGRGI